MDEGIRIGVGEGKGRGGAISVYGNSSCRSTGGGAVEGGFNGVDEIVQLFTKFGDVDFIVGLRGHRVFALI